MPSASPELQIARLQRQQAALAAFGSYAFREPDLQKILTEAARICAECLGVPYCKICRYRPADRDLLIEAGHGWQDGVVGLVVSKADETSPQGRAFVTGLPVIIPNLREANNVRLPAFYAQHGIISTIDVLIRGFDGAPYGVLEIDSAVEHAYDEHDIHFLTGFANVLAEAVATLGRRAALQEAMDRMRSIVVEKDRLLEEKNVLAEELKHRVRNNLQLVLGMLASHQRSEPGSDETASVQGIIRRVITLSEVYEQLLGTGMGQSIDLGEYLKSLCRRLPGLQASPHPQIALTCHAVTMLVDLDTVTALGMVVAELVSNSYEHAFTAAGGRIDVRLGWASGADSAVLTLTDDGAGFIPAPGSKRHGIGLVRRLAQQLHGTLGMETGPGTAWTLRFPATAPALRPAA